MTAISILADFVRRRAIPAPSDDDPDAIYFDNGHAREAIEALTSAGYRILAPGELDAETLEAAAQVADMRAARLDELMASDAEYDRSYDRERRQEAWTIAGAIRSLKGGSE